MVFNGSTWPQYVSQTYVLYSCAENIVSFAENVKLDSSINVPPPTCYDYGVSDEYT